MKLIALVCLMVLGVSGAFAEPLTQGERDRALSALHGTRKQFIDIVTAATPAQWNFKPAPDVWSLAEIAEHITLSERDMPQAAQKGLATPGDPAKLEQTKGKDQAIMTGVADRSQKAKAPESLTPKKTFGSKDATLAAFKEYRDKNLAFIRTTDAPLRQHLADAQFGTFDCYQWYLVIAAHSERHIAQMREVMANPNFPKN